MNPTFSPLRRFVAFAPALALAGAILPRTGVAGDLAPTPTVAPATSTDAPAAGSTAAATTATDPWSGEAVIRRHVQAIGGVEAIAKVKTFRMLMTLEMPAQNLKGNVTVARGLPDWLRVTTEIPGLGVMEQGWDGKVGWATDAMMGPRILQGKELGHLKQQGSELLGYADLRSHFKSMESRGRTTFEGRESDAVFLVTKEGIAMTAHHDPATGLQFGAEITAATPMGDVAAKMNLEDYKEFAGIRMPTLVRQVVLGMEQRIVLKDFQANPQDLPAIEMPPSVKALLGGPAAPSPKAAAPGGS